MYFWYHAIKLITRTNLEIRTLTYTHYQVATKGRWKWYHQHSELVNSCQGQSCRLGNKLHLRINMGKPLQQTIQNISVDNIYWKHRESQGTNFSHLWVHRKVTTFSYHVFISPSGQRRNNARDIGLESLESVEASKYHPYSSSIFPPQHPSIKHHCYQINPMTKIAQIIAML